jgi:hypothetical protein
VSSLALAADHRLYVPRVAAVLRAVDGVDRVVELIA